MTAEFQSTSGPAAERSAGPARGRRAPLRPIAALAGVSPYAAPRRLQAIDVHLDANEGPALMSEVALRRLAVLGADALQRYPSADVLEREIGATFSVEPDRVLVTAGGDEAIDRVMRVMLEPGRVAIQLAPTFVMIERSARRCGAEVKSVPWSDDGSIPLGALLNAIDDATAVVAIVSPNNPTGAVAPLDAMERVIERAAAVGAIVLVDLAYVEFADEDPTIRLAQQENVAIVRTFSKAWGLAGLRVGYTIAAPEVIRWMRIIGGPYPVSGAAVRVACDMWRNERRRMLACVEQVRNERARLFDLLRDLRLDPLASQANFVAARRRSADEARRLVDALASRGVGVRGFERDPQLERLVRITCPGDEATFERLTHALRAATQPRAIGSDRKGAPAGARGSIRGTDAGGPPVSDTSPLTAGRTAEITRTTDETAITCRVTIDGAGRSRVRTGVGFLDHLLTTLALHARIDLSLECRGDLHVDDHHTVEDCALALGSAIDAALGPRAGITRFGCAHAPLDESLARAVIDLSGRPWCEVKLRLVRERVGDLSCENAPHFFRSIAQTMRAAAHVDLIRGENDHHKIEAAFKAFALALREAARLRDPASTDFPSTKGAL
ncbi:MAG: imidazoleglycerol-phosphate dehydratase HisB [Planctomycetota bacterium]|nr:MAG: imidazoleglycerol-phosphate dehydratase HisB [Planctomycetota bacterium]